MDNNHYKSFAITATTLGHPRKLITPITVVNISEGKELIAATVNAMWDTGADICIMSRKLAEALRIKYDKDLPGHGIYGEGISPVGIAYIALLSNGELIDTYACVADSTSPTDDYSFIIGLDFIRKGSLAISSTKIDTTLSFTIPTRNPIDFTKLAGMVEGTVKYLPLSSTKEDIRPVFGAGVLDLIVPENFANKD